MAAWFLYIVRCRRGTLYTGIATDVPRRLEAHGSGKGARYLRGRGPLTLVYCRQVGSLPMALREERRVKRLGRPGKERLIAAAVPDVPGTPEGPAVHRPGQETTVDKDAPRSYDD